MNPAGGIRNLADTGHRNLYSMLASLRENPIVMCAQVGCLEQFPRYYIKKNGYANWSQSRKYCKKHVARPREECPRNLMDCACGCGKKIWDRDSRGRPRKYAHGHNGHYIWGRRGEQNGRWKGGRKRDSDGYCLVKKPNHPHTNNHGYVREHRLVYEESRNCCILPRIDVHHRDGDKTNNVWYNLMLVLPSQHAKMHNSKQDFGALCRCGSKNIGLGIQNDRRRFHCKD
jgi:hypothetical protein